MAEYFRINQQYSKDKNQSKGLEAIASLKAQYVINPNDLLFLEKPFNHTMPYVQKMEVLSFEDLPGRVFILFSTRENPWPKLHKAYEIDATGSGKKIFLQSFIVFGL